MADRKGKAPLKLGFLNKTPIARGAFNEQGGVTLKNAPLNQQLQAAMKLFVFQDLLVTPFI